MRVGCVICNSPPKAKCNGKNGGPTYIGPLCSKHYERLRRYGDPNFQPPLGGPKGPRTRISRLTWGFKIFSDCQ